MMRVLTLTLLVLIGYSAAAEPPTLHNNPFTRPPTLVLIDTSRPVEDLGGAPLLLIATMVSPTRSIANVEGLVLQPGDEIRGYVLRRVLEDHAVFARGEKEIVVYVKPEMEEDDEQPTPNPRRR